MYDPHQPPNGWQVVSGILEPDRTVRGYYARGQDVDGRCHLRDCRRTCQIDIKRIHGQGLGRLNISQIKRTMRCNRLDGCALDFRDDLKAESLKLHNLTGRPAVAIKITCRACGFSRPIVPEVMIARLKAEGKGGEETETRDLPSILTGPCKACRKTSWGVQVIWPDPNTLGGRQAISSAKSAVSGPIDPLDF